MLNQNHRHKLIEGLVRSMGEPDRAKPKLVIAVGGPPSSDSGSGDDLGKPEEGSPEEERDEPDDEKMAEAHKCARDLANALGVDDIDDEKAMAIVEAIKTIAGGY